MRREKRLELEPGRVVHMREMQVRHIHAVFGRLAKGGLGLEHLLDPGADGVAGLLGDCLVLPEGEVLADQVPADLDAIWQAFQEVNQYFFDRLEGLGLSLQTGPGIPSGNWSGNAAASSSGDTGTSGTTAGGSSSPPSSGRTGIESEAQRAAEIQNSHDELEQESRAGKEPQPIALSAHG